MNPKEKEAVLQPQVNKRMASVRAFLGLNQMDMSALLDTDQSNYSRTENGKQNVSVPIVYALIYKVKVSPNWLFCGEGMMFLTEPETVDATKTILEGFFWATIEQGQDGLTIRAISKQ